MKPVIINNITILSCSGCGNCKYGIVDTDAMVNLLEIVNVAPALPAKCKIAVAGCSRCCTMPFVRDIGLIPSTRGWTVIFGGNGGGQPRIGDIIAADVRDQDVRELVFKCLQVYSRNALPKQRTSRFIEKFGMDRFKEQLFQK
ncbi:MAG: hypothetical protein V2I35_04510 [Desulfocapsaceae bacterium]|nr:hypothetical protein [Desulfocapsaceae bacterium]